jgi:hypothetical protein
MISLLLLLFSALSFVSSWTYIGNYACAEKDDATYWVESEVACMLKCLELTTCKSIEWWPERFNSDHQRMCTISSTCLCSKIDMYWVNQVNIDTFGPILFYNRYDYQDFKCAFTELTTVSYARPIKMKVALNHEEATTFCKQAGYGVFDYVNDNNELEEYWQDDIDHIYPGLSDCFGNTAWIATDNGVNDAGNPPVYYVWDGKGTYGDRRLSSVEYDCVFCRYKW